MLGYGEFNFAQKTNLLILRFFNYSEYLRLRAYSIKTSREICNDDFHVLKETTKETSTSAGFEHAILESRADHVTPRPQRPAPNINILH